MQLSRDDLREAYKRMTTIREFEDTLHEEFSAGNIPGFVHLYAGEEASGVGVCMHLDDRDAIASTHRGHGHCIAKGVDPTGMMLEIYGKKDGVLRRQGRLDAYRRPVEGHDGGERHRRRRPAAGLRGGAYREDLEDRRRGDRLRRRWRVQPGHHLRELQPRQGLEPARDLHRRRQWLCREHGQRTWSVGGSQAARAAGFDMPCTEVDGHDFFAVWEAAREAIDHARSGKGPHMLHFKLNRYYGHFEGDAITYKAPDEIDKIKAAKDCLMLFKQRVTEAGLAGGRRDGRDREGEQSGDRRQCLASAKAGDLPTKADLLTDVYTNYPA